MHHAREILVVDDEAGHAGQVVTREPSVADDALIAALAEAAKPSIGKERARRFLEETEEVRRAAIAHLVAADLLLMQIRRRAA